MRQLAFESNTSPAYILPDTDQPELRRLAAVRTLLSALAALALLMTIAGPGLTHHYAEFTPFHAHIFHGATVSHVHGLNGSIYHDHTGGTAPDVVSVSGDSGASAGIAGFSIVPPTERSLIEPDGLWHPADEAPFIYADPEPDVLERPPVAS